MTQLYVDDDHLCLKIVFSLCETSAHFHFALFCLLLDSWILLNQPIMAPIYQALVLILMALIIEISNGDLMRKSIVFDSKTPKVFYCPQEKPIDMNKMIVKAIPLERLCEYEGQKNIPKNARSDCYNDVDESEHACAEKQRIELRINPPIDSMEETSTIIPTPDAPEHIKQNQREQLMKKKKSSTKFNGKKL
ncbi:uncharacterized protein LOC113799751 isoform X2 [Dermatophagoides pteronyssinus]|uniref:uncharacterized protein LOC113799751 isoform X2 n=1 Tax=Dermatophagoides pteronyssinus TaxID=6956 RepID=UPI003F66D9F2